MTGCPSQAERRTARKGSTLRVLAPLALALPRTRGHLAMGSTSLLYLVQLLVLVLDYARALYTSHRSRGQ